MYRTRVGSLPLLLGSPARVLFQTGGSCMFISWSPARALFADVPAFVYVAGGRLIVRTVH